jgi:hypothetical protein
MSASVRHHSVTGVGLLRDICSSNRPELIHGIGLVHTICRNMSRSSRASALSVQNLLIYNGLRLASLNGQFQLLGECYAVDGGVFDGPELQDLRVAHAG